MILIISSKNFQTANSLEKSSLLIKGFSETTQNEAK